MNFTQAEFLPDNNIYFLIIILWVSPLNVHEKTEVKQQISHAAENGGKCEAMIISLHAHANGFTAQKHLHD